MNIIDDEIRDINDAWDILIDMIFGNHTKVEENKTDIKK